MSATPPSGGGSIEGLFVRRSSGLTRQVSAWDALMFCALGPGLTLPFIYLLWTPYLFPGSNYLWANIFAVFFLPTIAVYFLFSVAMPRSGGEYMYVTRSLGPVWGMIASFIVAITMVTSVAITADWGVTYGLGDSFAAAGIGGSAWATGIGDFLFSQWGRTILDTLFILIGCYVWLRGTKWVMRLSWTVVMMTAVVLVMGVIGVIVGGGPSGFISQWNALSGTNYDDILKLASSQTYVVNITVGGTLAAGFSYVALNTIGSTFSANIAGEIRGVQRSQLIALFGSIGLLIVFWMLLTWLVYWSIGGEFSNALAQIFHGSPDLYPAILGGKEPIITLMFGFFITNPIFLIVFGILLHITIWTGGTALGFAVIRNIFAWSFDRIIPAKFAELDSRYHSPWLVIVVFGIIAEVIVLLQIWASAWMVWSSVNIIAWFIGWFLVGFAAIFFPWRRKQLFDSAPGIVNARLAGIPIISILGVISLAACGYVEWTMVGPFLAGTSDPFLLVYVAAWIVIPIIIFYVSKAVRASAAVPLDMQFTELPPE
jgi:amino acid transporter